MNAAEQSLLLVDEDSGERTNIATMLTDAGFTVHEAKNGRQALGKFRKFGPVVVLCDLNNSGIEGEQLVQVIASEPTDASVIVLSSDGGMYDVVEALRFGADDYFIKPIADVEVLVHSIRRCCEQRNLRLENLHYQEQLELANQGLQESLQVLEQDQLAGKQVQLKMLPASSKQFGDYNFQSRLMPSLLLSGDFVEYFSVGDDHVVFFLADVSGHGASSAFVTVLLKNMFARKRSDFIHRNDATILSPADMLDVANRNLINTEIGKHATLCVGVIDQRADTLVYSVGGHLPLPIMSTNEGCQYLLGEGMPVGLFESAEYSETTVALPDNFALTLFSDGILEILGIKGLVEQENYLLSQLESYPDNIEQLSETLKLDDVADAPDDITMLLITKNLSDK